MVVVVAGSGRGGKGLGAAVRPLCFPSWLHVCFLSDVHIHVLGVLHFC